MPFTIEQKETERGESMIEVYLKGLVEKGTCAIWDFKISTKWNSQFWTCEQHCFYVSEQHKYHKFKAYSR